MSALSGKNFNASGSESQVKQAQQKYGGSTYYRDGKWYWEKGGYSSSKERKLLSSLGGVAELGGGGGGGGSSSNRGGWSPRATSGQDALAAAAKQWEILKKYAPQQAQLYMDLSRQFLPQQYELAYGMTNQYAPLYQQLMNQLARSSRESDVATVAALAPQLQGIREAAESPATTAMRNALMGQVNEELAMGTRLTPEQSRDVVQGLRSAELARGIAGGSGGAAREAVARALEGQKLQTQRQQKAQSVLGQEYGASAEPFAAILGRSPVTFSATQSQTNTPLQQTGSTGDQIKGYDVSIPISGQEVTWQLGLGQLENQANALELQNTQYNNMLSYLPMLMNMYNS